MSELDRTVQSGEPGPASLAAKRLWPTYFLIALAWPFWLLLRGSFGWTSLRMTVYGTLLSPFIMFALMFAFSAAQPEGQSFNEDPMFDYVFMFNWPFGVETYIAVLCISAWIALMVLHNFLAPLFYRVRRLPTYGGGRFILLPHDRPESLQMLFVQWLIVMAVPIIAWLNPPLLIEQFPAIERMNEIVPGLITNAAAFIILSGLTYYNQGNYPGLPAGERPAWAPKAQPYRFVSSLNSKPQGSDGLYAIFSRRDPALKTIIEPGQN